LLTEKIKRLAAHLKKNRMDKHSRRGLLGLVDKRRRHIKYVAKTSPEKIDEINKKIKED
jgi:small subunit ribosomal protein S15